MSWWDLGLAQRLTQRHMRIKNNYWCEREWRNRMAACVFFNLVWSACQKCTTGCGDHGLEQAHSLKFTLMLFCSVCALWKVSPKWVWHHDNKQGKSPEDQSRSDERATVLIIENRTARQNVSPTHILTHISKRLNKT